MMKKNKLSREELCDILANSDGYLKRILAVIGASSLVRLIVTLNFCDVATGLLWAKQVTQKWILLPKNREHTHIFR